MNEEHTPRSRTGVVVRLALGVAAAIGAWYVLRHWAYVSGDVEWLCDGSGCGTDDPRPMLAIAGGFLAVLASALLVTVLRLAGFGTALSVASLALVTGWDEAFADRQVDVVSGQAGIWRTIAYVGLGVAALGLVIEVRLPGPAWRLLGWERVPAELGEIRDGTAMLAYTDHDGRGHEVRVRAPEQLRGRPVSAYYLVRDPSRARLAPGKQKVLRASSEDATLSTELTRLATLHVEGHLTDAEFEQAKRRVLGG